MEFYTKVVGVSFDGRQRLIRQTRVGESLSLVRDPNNQYDRNATVLYSIMDYTFNNNISRAINFPDTSLDNFKCFFIKFLIFFIFFRG